MSMFPLQVNGSSDPPSVVLQLARFLNINGSIEVPEIFNKLPPPACQEAIENLTDVALEGNGVKKCPICLRNFEMGEIIKVMPCGDLYHKLCICPWLEKTCTCPVCRFELPTNNPEYEQRKRERVRQRFRQGNLAINNNSH